MLVRCVTSTFDCRTRTPKQNSQACWKLRKTMYGSLDAAQRWGEHYAQVLETGGFSRGVASPCHFFHKELEPYILVHGDDFFSGPTGEAKACTEFAARCIQAEQSCDYGPRVVAVTDSEFLGQDADVALKALGLTNAEGVATPGTDDVGGPQNSKMARSPRRDQRGG